MKKVKNHVLTTIYSEIFYVTRFLYLWNRYDFVAFEKIYQMKNTKILVISVFKVKYLLKENI